MNETNDPKLKSAAQSIARAFKSKPLSWRLQDDDQTLVVVLASGPKVHGTQEGPDPELLAQLVKPEQVVETQEEPASAAGSEEASKAKSKKKGDHNQ